MNTPLFIDETLSAPGPTPGPWLGNLPELRRKGMIQFYVDAWRNYGDLVRFQLGPMPTHLAIHPDHLRYILLDQRDNYTKGRTLDSVRHVLGNGLFASEGALWQRQRRIMAPIFTPKAVAMFTDQMVLAIDSLLAEWEQKGNESFELNFSMMKLAMDVISITTLGRKIGQDSIEAANAFTIVLDYISHTASSFFALPLFVPTQRNRNLRTAYATINNFIYNVIGERRKMENPPQDLLTILIKALSEEYGQGNDQQLRDEITTIFFAGHETTAQTLTWVWQLLEQHPTVREKLYAEVDTVLGGRVPTFADTYQLKYTRMVVEETLRLYPPVWIFAREAKEDDTIAGYHIPKESMIILSPYITHRHPDFWEFPDAFYPEHFAPAAVEARSRYAFIPFGAGPRICLGNSFALLEAVLAVAMIAQRYRVRLEVGQDIRPKMISTLRPSGPMMVHLEKREENK